MHAQSNFATLSGRVQDPAQAPVSGVRVTVTAKATAATRHGRMLIDLALTVPDAHVGHGAQTGDMSPLYRRPGQRSAITIGGNRPNSNYYLLDGVTNTDPTFNTMNLSLSPDAVQEFQVQTGSCRPGGRRGPGLVPPGPIARPAAMSARRAAWSARVHMPVYRARL